MVDDKEVKWEFFYGDEDDDVIIFTGTTKDIQLAKTTYNEIRDWANNTSGIDTDPDLERGTVTESHYSDYSGEFHVYSEESTYYIIQEIPDETLATLFKLTFCPNAQKGVEE